MDGCLVAYEMNGGTRLAGQQPTSWSLDGFYIDRGETHPLDIIRIEKAPKPVVAERYLSSDDGESWFMTTNPVVFQHSIKLTIINGKMDKWEQVK